MGGGKADSNASQILRSSCPETESLKENPRPRFALPSVSHHSRPLWPRRPREETVRKTLAAEKPRPTRGPSPASRRLLDPGLRPSTSSPFALGGLPFQRRPGDQPLLHKYLSSRHHSFQQRRTPSPRQRPHACVPSGSSRLSPRLGISNVCFRYQNSIPIRHVLGFLSWRRSLWTEPGSRAHHTRAAPSFLLQTPSFWEHHLERQARGWEEGTESV